MAPASDPSLVACLTMTRSSLSEGGRIAVAAKESASPALGLDLMKLLEADHQV